MYLPGPFANAQQKQLKAGAAMVDITPPLGLGIVGNFIIPPATHIHDPLHARCLVLDDGTSKQVFVVADNCGIARELLDYSKKLITAETGIPGENVLMAATHTHSAVNAGVDGEWRKAGSKEMEFEDYHFFLARRMADAVRIAVNNLEPARLGWGSGSVPQHLFNRRWKLKEKIRNPFGEMDQVQFNPGIDNPNKVEPAGGTDPEVTFLSVQSTGGRPIALLANYSLHYVGGVPVGHVSADYFALFAEKIREKIAQQVGDTPPFVAFMTNGTSGDVNNINFRGPAAKHPPYEKMNIVAEDVAREVLRAYNEITYRSDISLKTAYTELPVAVRKPSQKIYEQSLKVKNSPEGTKFSHPLERVFAERAVHVYENWPGQVEVPLQVFRIGDLGIAGIPLEVFTEMGLDIRKRAPFAKAFTISFANGSFGYLPTPAQHKLGGYETWLTVTKVEETASEKITQEVMRLFEQVK
ncbi:MAG: hypothetical protein ABS46_10715 [Cytophagaceae bacterium SCN 52-12]|nr:MAG: hypothetical protein ABS46_10715 [Cytophagaceae bacterium SCN 52-12]